MSKDKVDLKKLEKSLEDTQNLLEKMARSRVLDAAKELKNLKEKVRRYGGPDPFDL